jgi:hypothetical protein
MIWGWASWASVWESYDPEIKDWPIQRENLATTISEYQPSVNFWMSTFERMFKKEIDTWDYQFSYLLLKNKGKCIVPRANLITNVGFGADATHTFSVESEAANRKRFEINIPLRHSPSPASEEEINAFYDKHEFSTKPIIVRAINKLARLTFGKNVIS